jgi:hypothetical protein
LPNGSAGGAGVAVSITGSSITRAGGGGGGSRFGSGGAGGAGGGGNGAAGTNGTNGDVNTGEFVAPQPFESWTLDENNDWQPPTPKPDGAYYWDENLLVWVEYDKQKN